MRHLLIFVALVALAGLFIYGCAVEKTYTTGLDPTEDMCAEVTTSDADIQADLEDAGFEEGTCPSTNQVGDGCDVSAAITDGGDEVDMTFYFYSPTFTAEDAALTCAFLQLGGLK